MDLSERAVVQALMRTLVVVEPEVAAESVLTLGMAANSMISARVRSRWAAR
jgi:hypothetical protein